MANKRIMLMFLCVQNNSTTDSGLGHYPSDDSSSYGKGKNHLPKNNLVMHNSQMGNTQIHVFLHLESK